MVSAPRNGFNWGFILLVLAALHLRGGFLNRITMTIQSILRSLDKGEVPTIEENTVFVDDNTVNVLEIVIDVKLVGWCGDAPILCFEDTVF